MSAHCRVDPPPRCLTLHSVPGSVGPARESVLDRFTWYACAQRCQDAYPVSGSVAA
jgi:hypothetical protein